MHRCRSLTRLNASGVARIVFAAVALTLASLPASLRAQDEPELGWFTAAELSLLFTGGNSSAQTFGLGASARHVWEQSELSFRAGSLRAKTGTKSRTALGTTTDFVVNETTNTELTAENYFASVRFERSLSERVFLYAGAGWERNTFAGFDNRYALVGGLGNAWVDNDGIRFKTGYGFTFTSQEDVIEDPTTSDSFGGLRLNSEFWKQLSASSSFESILIVDESLNETQDLRADFTNSLIVDLSDALAFKTSFRVLFDNLPALTGVSLEQPLGTPTGDTVLVALNEIDTILTVALVASF